VLYGKQVDKAHLLPRHDEGSSDEFFLARVQSAGREQQHCQSILATHEEVLSIDAMAAS
jgi:hypothetical protein